MLLGLPGRQLASHFTRAFTLCIEHLKCDRSHTSPQPLKQDLQTELHRSCSVRSCRVEKSATRNTTRVARRIVCTIAAHSSVNSIPLCVIEYIECLEAKLN